MDNPAISVIIAACNCETFIEACLASVSAQSFGDFEIVVCEDGSTDNTWSILKNIEIHEPRLRLIRNAENQGLATSLNTCINAARGHYLARLDADDLAVPNRLETQYRMMSDDPTLILTGGNVLHISPEGEKTGRSEVLLQDSDIRAQCFFQNPFTHPSTMFRRDTLIRTKLSYNPSFQTTQDWDLWIRLMKHGKVANIPNILVHQTIHPASISKTKRAVQIENSVVLQIEQASGLLEKDIDPEKYRAINNSFLAGRDEAKLHGIDRAEACLMAIEIFDAIKQKFSEVPCPAFENWFLRRCVIIGLYPPPSWNTPLLAYGVSRIKVRTVLEKLQRSLKA